MVRWRQNSIPSTLQNAIPSTLQQEGTGQLPFVFSALLCVPFSVSCFAASSVLASDKGQSLTDLVESNHIKPQPAEIECFLVVFDDTVDDTLFWFLAEQLPRVE
jgi:hypothetical protein